MPASYICEMDHVEVNDNALSRLPPLSTQILTSLGAAETEIVQRNKTVEACWSTVAVSDLQTTSEGEHLVARHL